MSGIFGGGDDNKTQKVVNTSEPYPQAKPLYNEFLKNLQTAYQSGALYQKPFPGQTVAPTSPETAQAWQGTADRAMAGSDLNRAAQSQIMSRLDPNYLLSDSPGLKSIIDNARQGVNAEFSRGGRTFSAAHAGGLGSSEGQLRYQDLLRKAGEQTNAIGMAPQLAREDYFDLQQLGGVGQQREGKLQDLINAEIERFNALQGGQIGELETYRNLFSGLGGGTNTTTQPKAPSGNPWVQGIGGIASLASLFMPGA